MRPLLLFLLLTTGAFAQPLILSLQGGLRATSATEPNYGYLADSESRPYLVGAAAEVRLPHGF